MTIKDQLHKSRFHREGFDPNCPRCLYIDGVKGIIAHLKACMKQNETDAANANVHMDIAKSRGVAGEQRRMVGILNLYRKVMSLAAEEVDIRS